jgi:hypothetical protein
MFVEPGTDRHLVPELTFAAVSLYVLGKYMDGFIKGLGVQEVGEKHGKAVADAINHAGSVVLGTEKPDKASLMKHSKAMVEILETLSSEALDQKATNRARLQLETHMIERGVPTSEARVLSQKVILEVWRN